MAESQNDMQQAIDMPAAPAERRTSARVPLDRPIRIGPPGGLPYATVSARDLSSGGLFIDAERAVRVGARFSVEVPLDDSSRVYVSEAEVVDNRRTASAQGFGARFIEASREAKDILEREVSTRAHVTLRDTQVDKGLDPLEGPTFDSGKEGKLPHLSDLVQANQAMASVLPSEVSGQSDLTFIIRVRSRWSRMKAWMRSLPWVSAALYGLAGLALVFAAYLMLSEPPRIKEIEQAVAPRRVAGAVHEQVVEGGSPVGFEEVPELDPADLKVVNPLPEPVLAPEPKPQPQAPVAKARSTSSPRPETRPDPAPSSARPKARPGPSLGRGPITAAISLPSGSSIKKQFRMKNPERLVVDVRSDEVVRLPELSIAGVRRVRLGRHEGFTRLVFDLEVPAKQAKARLRSGKLQFSIEPTR